MLSNPTIPGQTINELLKYWASSTKKDIPAFVSISSDGKKQILSRHQVYQLSSAFAYRLSSVYGVVKGDVVCVALPNCLERIVCDMGVLLTGATSMNGQIFRADGEDFIESLKLCQAKFVITDPGIKNGAWNFLKDFIVDNSLDRVSNSTIPFLHQVIICQRNCNDLNADFLSSLRSSNDFLDISVSPSDVATIMTTSGSTGYSKLVPFSHYNICHFCLQVKVIEPLKEGEHFINSAPLGWAGGYPQWYLGCGVTRYFIDMYDGPPPDLPAFVWHVITSEKISYGFISPLHCSAILNNSALWRDVSWKPRTLCLAGQPINMGHLEIIGKLCNNVDINYGMTECNLVSTHRIVDPSSFVNGCAGIPGYGVSLKIVDSNNQELPNGLVGEIMIRSPALTSGYLNNETVNEKVFKSDGWFSTDDAGYIDPSTGKLHVEGRQSDSITRGAYILYPGWLEQKIKSVDNVKDVVIVPVPDKVLHNEICACIVTDIPLCGVVPGSVKFIDSNDRSITLIDASQIHESVPQTSENGTEENNIDYTDCNTVINCHSQKQSGSLLNCLDRSSSKLESIRKSGMKRPLSVPYNKTSVKSDFIKSSGTSYIQNETKTNHSSDLDCMQLHSLVNLEQKIRKYISSCQVLDMNDSMRMEPCYYVFFDRFVTTSTGKNNRKEVQKLALMALTKQ